MKKDRPGIEQIISEAATAARDAVDDSLTAALDEVMFYTPEHPFPNVTQRTLEELQDALSLLDTDRTAAEVYFGRVLRDFGEGGFHAGKLL
jgi:hypothetical protein